MSLGVVVKGPEGVVLAADSRVTLLAGTDPSAGLHNVNYDNATKLLAFSGHPWVAAVTYGTAVIGLRTAHSFLPEFEIELKKIKENRLAIIKEYAQRLSDFFTRQWKKGMPATWSGPPMHFIVAGFDREAAYGSVFTFEIPTSPEPLEVNPGEMFGMTWGGQHDIASRLLQGFAPELPGILAQALGKSEAEVSALFAKDIRPKTEFRIPYVVLPLQDCVDLATFLVRTTVVAQAFAVGVRGVGGPIDVAYITRTQGLTYVQRKSIHGESGGPGV